MRKAQQKIRLLRFFQREDSEMQTHFKIIKQFFYKWQEVC